MKTSFPSKLFLNYSGKAGYYTFNEGGKDDYNFTFKTSDLYDFIPKKRGWGPAALAAGECWKGKKDGQPFFGQVQLGGGKLGKRAKKVIDRAKVPVPPYYPDTALVREEIAHHYDCLLTTDNHVGQVIEALKRDGHYENTLIFLFSDHGYKLHRHKQYLYEGGIHMPLIVAGPSISKGRCVMIWSVALMSLLQVYPLLGLVSQSTWRAVTFSPKTISPVNS